jgi:hypothetical protein
MVEPMYAGISLITKRIPPKHDNLAQLSLLYDSEDFIKQIGKKAPASMEVRTNGEERYLC